MPVVRIRIIAVGKDKERWVTEGCEHFGKLLSRFARIEWIIIPAVRVSAALTPSQIRQREAARIRRELEKGLRVALSDRGEKCDSAAFAARLENFQTRCQGIINFLIGGAYGLDKAILKEADVVLSLSPMTFSHQLVRLILLEQLYRAFSILHGSDYHK